MKGEEVIKKLTYLVKDNELLQEDVDVLDLLDLMAQCGVGGASAMYMSCLPSVPRFRSPKLMK